MNNQTERIQNAINHIKTATDVDPWAVEIAVEAMNMAIEALSSSEIPNSSDTIYRQVAIDAFLTELTKRERKNLLHTWSTVEVKYFVADMLEKLPSVQPDIIACGDCKHYIPHDKRCGYWNHGVQPLMWCSQAERRTND